MKILKGRVIDGTGAPAIEKGIVAVENGRIKTVCRESEYEIPEGIEVIAIKDATIMPGFIEQHSHLGALALNPASVYMRSPYEKTCRAVYDMGKLVEAGFTSVREVGGFANQMRESAENGLITAPRITSSGKAIVMTGGHADFCQKFPVEFNVRNDSAYIADGVDEIRKACRMQFREGAQFLKVFTTGGVTSQGDSPKHRQYSDEELRTVVEEAEMHCTYVASHSQTLNGIKAALRAGIKSIEHANEIDEEALELFVKNDAWIVPTFSIVACLMDNIDKMSPESAKKLKNAEETLFESIGRAYKAGITIGYGCDLISEPGVCPYGENNLREFSLLVRMGMSPMEAIMAATKTGSRLVMREDQIGTLEPGKLADITVCTGNPLEDIEVLTKIDHIKLVMIGGEIKKHIV